MGTFLVIFLFKSTRVIKNMKKYLYISFVFVFILSFLFINNEIAFAAVLKASATISPNTADVGQSVSYTITITNDENSSASIGSVSLTLDPGFTIPDASNITVTAPHPWDPASIIGGIISSRATNGITDKLDPGEFVQFQFSSTAHLVAGSYTWTAEAFKNIGLTGPFDPISPQPTVIVSSPKADQIITFETLGEKIYGDADFSVNATANSGLIVAFSSQTPNVCAVSDSTVHIVSAGSCTVRASQAGDDNYNAAPDVDQSFTIAQMPITVTADALSKTYGDPDPALTYTSDTLVGEDEFSGALARELGEAVGTYPITQGTLALSDNYILNFIGANLTINPADDVAPTDSNTRHSGGGRYIAPQIKREIPGCGFGTIKISSVTGESCALNIPHEENNIEGQVLGVEKFVFTMFLKREQPPYSVGVYANEALELQKFLNVNGYESGSEDGKFGPITEGAVIRFQLASGLKGDGVVGPLTRVVLNK